MHRQVFGVPIMLPQGCAHGSFRSTDSSGAACLLSHQLIDLVIVEREGVEGISRSAIRLSGREPFSTRSKPRRCSKAFALTILKQHYATATWGTEKCINSSGTPRASSRCAAPAGPGTRLT